MTAATGKRAAEGIARLLQEQRAALREGRLQDLAGMVPKMERALNALSGIDDQSLQLGLRRMAAENAALLQAASQGVERARAMRNGVSQVQLSTYDASGRKSAHTPKIGRTLARG